MPLLYQIDHVSENIVSGLRPARWSVYPLNKLRGITAPSHSPVILNPREKAHGLSRGRMSAKRLKKNTQAAKI